MSRAPVSSGCSLHGSECSLQGSRTSCRPLRLPVDRPYRPPSHPYHARQSLITGCKFLGTAEFAQIDQRVRHQLHARVPLLDTFTSEQQSLALVFPGKRPLDTHASRMDRGVEEPLAPTLGAPAVTGILCDVGDHAGIENALSIMHSIKAAIEIAIGPSEVQPDLCGHLFQRLQALGSQDHVFFVDRSHGDRR